MSSAACIAMALVGMTAPKCWSPDMENLMDHGMFLTVYGGSNYLAAARCETAFESKDACLSAHTCPDNFNSTFVDMSWRDVRDSRGYIIAPKSYTHILDCAEPGKEIQ